MNAAELGYILSDMYNKAPKGDKVAMIHVFGIKYAEQIESNNIATKEIIKFSEIGDSYLTELHKGIKLSKYVNLKY